MASSFAFDHHGGAYVGDKWVITHFSSDGVEAQWNDPELQITPIRMAVDLHDNIYVAYPQTRVLTAYAPDGATLFQVGPLFPIQPGAL